MLSKPSAPQAQLYGTVSLCLTLFLPFVSAFCSHTDPLSATVNRISCVIFQHCLTFCWIQITPLPSETSQSFEQLRQRVVNPASRQTAYKSLVLQWDRLADWTMTESLWQFDRVLSHKKQTNFHWRCNIYRVMMNSQTEKPHLFCFKENIVLEFFHSSQMNILHINARYHHQHRQLLRQNLTCTVKHSEIH